MVGNTADSRLWNSHWTEKTAELDDWDYLSQVVLQVLKEEIGDLTQKYIAEAGSGSGRISLRLTQAGADMTLIDYGDIALRLSRALFAKQGVEGRYVLADILAMPFRDGSFDVVWNAGVMEHYCYDRQGEILESLLRACKDSGVVITLNPFSRSFTYRLGKWTLEKLKKWPFGKEYPIRTIRDVSQSPNCHVVKEYPIGFVVTIIEAYKFLPRRFNSNPVFKWISRVFVGIAPGITSLDRVLSRILGGYLIVSVIKREAATDLLFSNSSNGRKGV